eukprot:c34379_g1_i1.p1 GENE.c34379_g1_i1~~c34379_g1_i1.p1  ORF type:complete len:105 (-),score=24.77 c34379_g1_i1:60-374(-)
MPNLDDEIKYTRIFNSFANAATHRLSTDQMIRLITACMSDVAESVASEQVRLAMDGMEGYDFLEGHIDADGVDYEGFKAAYESFRANALDEDLFMLEAYGLLAN